MADVDLRNRLARSKTHAHLTERTVMPTIQHPDSYPDLIARLTKAAEYREMARGDAKDPIVVLLKDARHAINALLAHALGTL